MAANLHNNLRARMNAMPQRMPPNRNPFRANQQQPQQPPPPHRPAPPAGGVPNNGPPPRPAPARANRGPPQRPAPAARAPAGGPPPRGPPHRPAPAARAPAGGAPPRGPPPRPAPAARGPPPPARPRPRAAAPPRGPPPGRRAGAPPPPHRPVPVVHVHPAGVPPMPPVPPPYVRPGVPQPPQPAVIPGTGMYPPAPPPNAVPGAVLLHQPAGGHGQHQQQQNQQDEKDDGILANQFILNDIIKGISGFSHQRVWNKNTVEADRRARLNRGMNLDSLNIQLRTGRASPMDKIYDSLNGGRAGRNNPLAGTEEEVKQRAQDLYKLDELKKLINDYSKNGGGQDVADRLHSEIADIEKKLNQKRGYMNNSYGPVRGSGLSTGDYGDNTSMFYLSISCFFIFL